MDRGRRIDHRVDHRIDHRRIFEASNSPAMVLDTELIIVTANPAFLEMTNRSPDDLVGRHVFDVFPAGPDESSDTQAMFQASFERVLATGQVDRLGVQRYDITASAGTERFEKRYWSLVNSPIHGEDGTVAGVLNCVEDVTAFRDDLIRALDFYRREAEAGDGDGDLNRRFEQYAGVTATSTRLYTDMVSEVGHLRSALTSRAVIDQAKGVVMAHHRCGPDEAFEMLSRLSQEENLKLRELSLQLVERVGRGLAPVEVRRAGQVRRSDET